MIVRLTGFRLQVAIKEWISSVSSQTSAARRVVYHRTLCVLAAGARAGVLALGPYAGQVRGTVGIHRALWSTSFVRVSYVIWGTGAGTCIVLLFAYRVGAAGRRCARGQRHDFDVG